MLELDRLSRRYGSVQALDRLSFAVREGQLFGFVGANGAGKTTAMRTVMGIERADDGEVRWRDQPVALSTRRRFGYMPEERGLYPKMPARRQLTYFARLHGLGRPQASAAADAWVRRLGLAERADEPAERLSQGNQQRVQLAAALVHEPELLVLDEPFSGLDPLGVDDLTGALVEQADRGVPVLFSSHQLELVERLCDAVAIIADGRLVASGTVDELRRAGSGLRYRIRVAGADGSWAARLRGLTVRHDGDDVLVELPDPAGLGDLLRSAQAAGTVTHFAEERPSLAERYRQVIGQQADPAGRP